MNWYATLLPTGQKCRSLLVALATDCSGGTALEYVFIGAMTSCAIIGGLRLFGSSMNAGWLFISNTTAAAMSH